MNGRIYDPIIGRMLSPDINITHPWSTEGYNRYSYGLNNPLIYIDPTENSFFWAIRHFVNPFSIPKRIFNTMKIVIGIFAYNSHLSMLQNVLNWVSNLTLQAPQEVVGLTQSVVQKHWTVLRRLNILTEQRF